MNRYLKPMINLSWPIMMGMVLQSLMGTVDMYYVSKLGTVYTSALSIGANTFIVINVFSAIVSTGILSMSARRVGEGQLNKIPKLSMTGVKMSLFIGLIVLLLSYGREGMIISLLYDTNKVTTDYVVEYLSIIVLFVPFLFMNSSLRSTMHAMSNTKLPLIIFGISNIINMILDPILIFKLNMGISGAALATGISIVFASVMVLYFGLFKLYGGQLNEMVRDFFTLNLDYMKRILKIGIWDAIQQVTRPFTGILMFRIVYQVGRDAGTAAFGIGGQIVSYTFIFLTGLTIAVSVLVGQKLGADEKHEVDEILKFAFKLAAVNMVFFAIPYIIFPQVLFKFFTSDQTVILHGVNYLKIVYVGFIFVLFPIVYGGALKGAGYTFGPMMASILANLVIKIPAAYLFAVTLKLGVNGVWWAVAVSVISEAVIIFIMEKKKDWKSVVV